VADKKRGTPKLAPPIPTHPNQSTILITTATISPRQRSIGQRLVTMGYQHHSTPVRARVRGALAFAEYQKRHYGVPYYKSDIFRSAVSVTTAASSVGKLTTGSNIISTALEVLIGSLSRRHSVLRRNLPGRLEVPGTGKNQQMGGANTSKSGGHHQTGGQDDGLLRKMLFW
jgi:hypothetical protein